MQNDQDKPKNKRPFDRVMAGLRDAIAYVNGDESQCIVHTPESIMRRRKERHRERAGLRIVPKDDHAP